MFKSITYRYIVDKIQQLPVFYFLTFSILISLQNNNLKAGEIEGPTGARSGAMGNSSVTLTDGWSTYNNQAAMGYLPKNIIAGAFFTNKYGLKELSNKAVFVTYPLQNGAIGATFKNYGYSNYSENRFGLAYGSKLLKRLALGVQVNYLETHFTSGYQKARSVAAEIGLLYEPVENLFVGFHWFKPAQRSMYNHVFESSARLGLSYLIGKVVLLNSEINTGENNNTISLGTEIDFTHNFFLRCGINSNDNFSFGLGYTLKKVTANIAFSKHPELGFSPQIDLGVSL